MPGHRRISPGFFAGGAGGAAQNDGYRFRGLALALLLALLPSACSKPTAPTHTNPADPDNPDFVQPGVVMTAPAEGDSILTAGVTFRWRGTGAASQYQRRIDNGAWSSWATDTAATYGSLSEGPHAFEVRAGDAGGYVGSVTAVRHITMNYYRNTLLLTATPSTVHVGDTVELACALEDMATPVSGARLYLYVNFNYLDTAGVTADTGYHWRQHGGTPVGPLFSTSIYGISVLDVTVGAAGGTPAGVTGSGRVFKIKAVAKAAGSTTIYHYTTPVVRDTNNVAVTTTQTSAAVTILAK
ncbi:MAG: hypothetical protein MUF78_10645 [Candidatus Edwardsbacteria bacterium]|nr:hypothetical protein [Candidatus Edwardsbacteria bacterium]